MFTAVNPDPGLCLFFILQFLPKIININRENSSMFGIGVRFFSVIPASKARPESFFKKDSGQAGMTDLIPRSLLRGCSLSYRQIIYDKI